jgi:DNA-binding response OmpR family regulator
MATILCIDDDRSLLEVQKALFESKGYRVLIAPNGPSGIMFTRKHPIDAIVLDFKMPGMDGNQVAEVLMKEQPTIPVVIWSGCPDHIPESLKWFADALLHKGDGPHALLAVVERLVSTGTSEKKPVARITGSIPATTLSHPSSSRVARLAAH